jgi:uncharacterized RDD family membrane protein YckC
MDKILYGSGLTRRSGAWIIDTALFSLPIAGAWSIAAGVPFTFLHVLAVAGNPLTFLVMWPYFALMESSRHQATLGKLICHIRVIDVQGRKISFGRATGRYFARVLSAMIGMIGVLMILFTKMNQSLHDMITKTVVIENGLFQAMKKNPGPNQAVVGTLPRGRVNAPHR